MKKVSCEKCGAEFMAEDLSDLFEDGENHYTCDECYQEVQKRGRLATENFVKENK